MIIIRTLLRHLRGPENPCVLAAAWAGTIAVIIVGLGVMP